VRDDIHTELLNASSRECKPPLLPLLDISCLDSLKSTLLPNAILDPEVPMRLNRGPSIGGVSFVIVLCAVTFLGAASGRGQSIEETYKQALKEGGSLNVYGTLTPDTA
jgi:hypothetical protein